MKHHLTSSSSTTKHLNSQDGTAEVLVHPVIDRAGRAQAAQAIHARPQLRLASPPVWRHKLILTGRLDQRTAGELEDEIECLCEEGVTTLTLDLRQLDAIDSAGARTIASRGAACKSRGRDFAVIPGSPTVRSALAEAGTESLLAGDPGDLGEAGVLRLLPSSPETSTAMIKNL